MADTLEDLKRRLEEAENKSSQDVKNIQSQIDELTAASKSLSEELQKVEGGADKLTTIDKYTTNLETLSTGLKEKLESLDKARNLQQEIDSYLTKLSEQIAEEKIQRTAIKNERERIEKLKKDIDSESDSIREVAIQAKSVIQASLEYKARSLEKDKLLDELENSLASLKTQFNEGDGGASTGSQELTASSVIPGEKIENIKTNMSTEIEKLKKDIFALSEALILKVDSASRELQRGLDDDLAKIEVRAGGGGASLPAGVAKAIDHVTDQISKIKKDKGPDLDERDIFENLKKELDYQKKQKNELEEKLEKVQKELAAAKRARPAVAALAPLTASGNVVQSSEGSGDSGSDSAGGWLKDSSLTIEFSDLKILKKIGTGGFAEVFEGTLHGERVAIKKLTNGSDVAGKKELEKECKIQGNLHSGFIAHLYGWNMSPSNLCMIMEYLPRGSLGYQLWDKKVPLPWERRWNFVRDCALAVNYLHTRQPPILHRDLKAANYLVTQDWRLKLTDFGCAIAKTEAGGSTDDFIGGTFQWTSPEVLSGQPYDERAEIFSYAMVVFEIVSREQPWQIYQSPEQQLTVRKWVGEGKRPTLLEAYKCPNELQQFMEGCWAQEPEKRWNMDAIIKALQRKGILDTTAQAEAEGGWADEKARIGEELELAKTLKEKAEKRATESEKEIGNMKRQKQDLEFQVSESKTKLELANTKQKSLEREKEDLERKIKAEKDKADQAKKQFEELDKKKKNDERKLKKAEEQQKEDADRIEELEKRLERERKAKQDLQKQLTS